MKKILNAILLLGVAVVMSVATFADNTPTETGAQAYTAQSGEYTFTAATDGKQSGVYKGDELLYNVGKTENISEVFISADGKSLALIHGAGQSENSTAITFYSMGKPKQEYSLGEVCYSFMRGESENGIEWQNKYKTSYNAEKEQLTVISLDKSVRIFEMKTGEITLLENPVKLTLALAGVVLLSFLVWLYWRSPYNQTKIFSDKLREEEAQQKCTEQKKLENELPAETETELIE